MERLGEAQASSSREDSEQVANKAKKWRRPKAPPFSFSRPPDQRPEFIATSPLI
ncbi:hypothetical protein [Paraburkholderia phytofirmans]|uniref:hypothetical protein n=1 Tax=Paraburkholderia phytofirmans TaxID=261302 RepID=UPI001427BC8A|nr:hypothetical protein [Paraburkholderia phytofirmans]